MNDYSYDFVSVDSQIDELEKLAIGRAVRATAGRIAQRVAQSSAKRGAGIGAGIGAVGGGALGAASADPQEGTAGRIGAGISGALSGAMLGAGGGLAATKAGRKWVGNQAKAQVHGLTGWVPGARKAGKGFTGSGMTGREKRKALEAIGFEAPERLSHGQALGQIRQGRIMGKLPQGMQQQLADLSVARNRAQREQLEKGLTSVPGFLKGMAKNPGATAKTGLLAAGGLGTAATVGFSAPEIYSAAKDRDPKRLGGALAETAFYGVGGGIPMLGSMALGSGVRRLGSLPAEAYEKVRAGSGGAA